MVDSERLRLLDAMGIDVYALRGRTGAPAREGASSTPIVDASGAATTAAQLIVVCARGVRNDARLARLFKQLPQIFGLEGASIDWLEADAQGVLAAPPAAPAYLVLGAAMARALGVQLSTMQQNSSAIAVTAEPARLPGSAMDKRALWQVLKPLAQRLRVQAG